MNKQKFMTSQLEALLTDPAIKKQFDTARSDEEREAVRKGLEQSLDFAYQTKAQEYFDSKGIASKISTVLRYAGAVADGIGTYAFWALGGAGFGFKGAGFLAKGLAELVDNRHYEAHRKPDGLADKYVTKDGLKIATEGAAQLAAAYLPVGGEFWALLRGTKKYDEKIVYQARDAARKEFLKRFTKATPEPAVQPVEEFSDEQYAQPKVMPLADYRRTAPYRVKDVPVTGPYARHEDAKVVSLDQFRDRRYSKAA